MTITQPARELVTDPAKLREYDRVNAILDRALALDDQIKAAARPVVAPPVGAVPPTLAGRAGGEKGAAA